MYRVAICDDDGQQRERVRRMLLALSVKSGIEFAVAEFESGERLIEHYENQGDSFHILILDIEMDGLNGIQTARRLREMKRHQEQIVFLTSYAEYMLESFDVVTFQYLIKPIEPGIFEAKMLKLCLYFQEREQEILIIKSVYEEIVLRQEDIIAIEAAKSLTVKSKLIFTTVDAIHEGKGLISSYASALKDSRFLQIHRSILINLIHVHKFAGGKVVMSNGMELPIGRSKIKEVKDACTKFMVMKVD
ncbi:LytTR family two component transcriptional regulator [Fontibacillus phaseoli]|uniref:LytTR family two component transcriptional regulator n=1 Tax=Fontibacillus phaseoli TaxID=1416533 RepID=A0A369BAP3_9BACL|nr:LytTR family DNA-binding domain-containing protein [Fontibacillus phaseoli]RCX17668.1 LytTR family two component transcriptional regulator [Fontibacillus phaseoli]